MAAAAAVVQHGFATQSQAGRAEIDAMLAGISTLMEQVPARAGVAMTPRVQVVELSPDVTGVWLERVWPFWDSMDVWIDVQASARLGGLLLSMAGHQIDLGSSSSAFTISIGGALGARVLSFASGTTLVDIAIAIRSFGPMTGVDAVVSGTGVRIQSAEYGSRQFVSVRVLEPGGIQGLNAGIYELSWNNFFQAAPWTQAPFNSWQAMYGIGSLGRDVVATVNWNPAPSEGAVIFARNWDLWATIGLTTGPPVGSVNAQTTGLFRAFRLERF